MSDTRETCCIVGLWGCLEVYLFYTLSKAHAQTAASEHVSLVRDTPGLQDNAQQFKSPYSISPSNAFLLTKQGSLGLVPLAGFIAFITLLTHIQRLTLRPGLDWAFKHRHMRSFQTSINDIFIHHPVLLS